LTRLKKLSDGDPQHAYCDKGYKGAPAVLNNTEIHLANKKRKNMKASEWKWYRRRSGIEPIIGHAKSDHRMDRNYLQGRGRRQNQRHPCRMLFQHQEAPPSYPFVAFKERFWGITNAWIALSRIGRNHLQPV